MKYLADVTLAGGSTLKAGNASSLGGGVGIVAVGVATTAPTTRPTDGGALIWGTNLGGEGVLDILTQQKTNAGNAVHMNMESASTSGLNAGLFADFDVNAASSGSAFWNAAGTQNIGVGDMTGDVVGLLGVVRHYGTGVASKLTGLWGQSVKQVGSGAVTAMRAVSASNSALEGTVTTAYGFYAFAPSASGTGAYTNAYGLFIEPVVTAGTLNVGAAIGAAAQNTLWLGYDSNATSAAGGITFGLSKDVSVYRSGAGQLNLNAAWSVDTSGRTRTGVGGVNAAAWLVLGGSAVTHPGTAATLYGAVSNSIFPTTTTGNAYSYFSTVQTAAATTIVNALSFYADAPNFGAGSAVTNSLGLQVANQGASTVTNAYGILVNAQSGAVTLNIAACLNGGTQANLWLNSNTASEAGGIAFGTARDVRVYRSAANTLNIASAGTTTLTVDAVAVLSHAIADAKGDILAASGADTLVRVPVGANGKVLTADSTATGGVSWQDAAGGGGSTSIARTFMMMGV